MMGEKIRTSIYCLSNSSMTHPDRKSALKYIYKHIVYKELSRFPWRNQPSRFLCGNLLIPNCSVRLKQISIADFSREAVRGF